MSGAVRAPAAPWLSILVPVYNVQDYLQACLASVLEQAAQLPIAGEGGAGVAVLVLDDCSTDGSRALMQQLAQRWSGRLTLMRHAVNQGLSAARKVVEGRLPALELFAEELRLSQQALGEITGEFTADDLLGVIFSRFCIGK